MAASPRRSAARAPRVGVGRGPWAGLLLAMVVLLAWETPLFWPLRLLVVVFHEAGHALVALATGGEVLSMQVHMDEGGLTMTRGGNHLLMLNGGYLGSMVAGAALLRLGRRDGRGRGLLQLLGVLLIASALAWFRPILSFGFAFTLTIGAAALVLGRRLPAGGADLAVRVVGLTSLLYGLFDVKADVLDHGLLAGRTRSDAAMLAELTHIPALVWGLGWVLIGGLLAWRLLRAAAKTG